MALEEKELNPNFLNLKIFLFLIYSFRKLRLSFNNSTALQSMDLRPLPIIDNAMGTILYLLSFKVSSAINSEALQRLKLRVRALTAMSMIQNLGFFHWATRRFTNVIQVCQPMLGAEMIGVLFSDLEVAETSLSAKIATQTGRASQISVQLLIHLKVISTNRISRTLTSPAAMNLKFRRSKFSRLSRSQSDKGCLTSTPEEGQFRHF